MSTQFTTFVDLLAILDLDGFARLPDAREDFFRLKLIREHASSDDINELIPFFEPNYQELTRVFATTCVRPEHDSPELVKELGSLISAEEKVESENIRVAAIQALKRLPSPTALEKLITALISERNPLVKSQLSYAINIHNSAGWGDKLKTIVSKIAEGPFHREQLDFQAILQAVRPPDDEAEEQRYPISKFVLPSAQYEDARMNGVVAGLVLEECNQNQTAALQLIADLKQSSNSSEYFLGKIVDQVRFPTSADQLTAELDLHFHEPLRTAHKDLRENWQNMQKTLFNNLTIRTYVTAVFSVLSVLLLVASFFMLFIFERWAEGLVGIIVALGVLLITFIFSGSMENARQAHFDIGASNTALTAFIQRSLELSNTFNFLYREGKLDTQMLQESENLIGKAMKTAAQEIRAKNRSALLDLLEDVDS